MVGPMSLSPVPCRVGVSVLTDLRPVPYFCLRGDHEGLSSVGTVVELKSGDCT